MKSNKRLLTITKKIFVIIMALVFCLVVVELALRLICPTKQAIPNAFRILTVGDSTTTPMSLDNNLDISYPAQLQKKLDKKFPNKFVVFNPQISSNDSSDIVRNINFLIEKYRPHMIISMIGINDTEKTGTKVSTFFYDIHSEIKQLHIIKSISRALHYCISKVSLDVRTSSNLQTAASISKLEHFIPSHALKYFIRYKEVIDNQDILRKKISQKVLKNIRLLYLRLALVSNFSLSIANLDQIAINIDLHLFSHARSLLTTDNQYSRLYLEGIIELIEQENFSIPPSLRKAGPFVLSKTNKINIYKSIITDIGNELIQVSDVQEFLTVLFHNDLQTALQASDILFKNYATHNNTAKLGALIKVLYQYNQIHFVQNLGEENNINISKHILHAAKVAELNNYPDTTKENYDKILQVALKNNITVIAMQYPLVPTRPLAKLLTKHRSRITILSNFESFEKALHRNNQSEIFLDLFAKHFGHCTLKGNGIIVNNLIPEILRISKEVHIAYPLSGNYNH